MKLLIHTLLVSILVGSTYADRMVRVVFNDGVSPTEETLCDTWDNLKIDQVFKPIERVRYLRDSTAADVESSSPEVEFVDEHVDRELWPTYCKNNCAGYATGTCRATGCVGYRKKDRHRQAQTLTCTDHVLKLNSMIDDVMTRVSKTCAAYLDPAKRNTECFDDVIYGVVEHFELWKSLTVNKASLLQTLQQTTTLVKDLVSFGPVADGFTICQYDRINIEAVVNPCVKLVTSTLTGPDGSTISRTDQQAPYTIFGDNAGTPMGRELPVGTYTFTAVPDNFDYKKQTITFRVKRC